MRRDVCIIQECMSYEENLQLTKFDDNSPYEESA